MARQSLGKKKWIDKNQCNPIYVWTQFKRFALKTDDAKIEIEQTLPT